MNRITGHMFGVILTLTTGCDGHVLDELSDERADGEAGDEVEIIDAALTSVSTYFSQRDWRWAADKLGTSNLTLGAYGCALTSATIAARARNAATDPGAMNRWLKQNGGFVSGNGCAAPAQCILVWSKVADFDGPQGLIWVGMSYLPTTTQAVKKMLDEGKLVVVQSGRFAEHWVILGGYLNTGVLWTDFYYMDPYDLVCTLRTLGDPNGWVKGGNQNIKVRIYR